MNSGSHPRGPRSLHHSGRDCDNSCICLKHGHRQPELKGTASITMCEIDPSHVKETSFTCSLYTYRKGRGCGDEDNDKNCYKIKNTNDTMIMMTMIILLTPLIITMLRAYFARMFALCSPAHSYS